MRRKRRRKALSSDDGKPSTAVFAYLCRRACALLTEFCFAKLAGLVSTAVLAFRRVRTRNFAQQIRPRGLSARNFAQKFVRAVCRQGIWRNKFVHALWRQNIFHIFSFPHLTIFSKKYITISSLQRRCEQFSFSRELSTSPFCFVRVSRQVA